MCGEMYEWLKLKVIATAIVGEGCSLLRCITVIHNFDYSTRQLIIVFLCRTRRFRMGQITAIAACECTHDVPPLSVHLAWFPSSRTAHRLDSDRATAHWYENLFFLRFFVCRFSLNRKLLFRILPSRIDYTISIVHFTVGPHAKHRSIELSEGSKMISFLVIS